MSIRIMTKVWGTDLPDSQMLIMLALADWADDDGFAWPSIAKLMKKTRKSERTVQNAIKAMAEAGHLDREEIAGKGVRYHLHPRDEETPADSAPPQNLHPRKARALPPQSLRPTPAKSAPNTLNTHHKHSTPPTPRRGKSERKPFPIDWILPSKADLPAEAKACAVQWPSGAYEAEGAAFASYRRGRGDKQVDWHEVWAARVIAQHQHVMRGAKVGITHGAAAGSASTAPSSPPVDAAAKQHEDRASESIHRSLKTIMGPNLYEQWMRPCAFLLCDDVLRIIAPNAFMAEWVEDRFQKNIKRALAAAEIQPESVLIEAENRKRGGKQP